MYLPISERVTDDELNELVDLFVERAFSNPDNEDVEFVRSSLEDAAVAKFPAYCTDSPGYSGPLYVIVWPASPGMVTVIGRSPQTKQLSVYADCDQS